MTDTNKLSELIEIIPRKIIDDKRGWFLKAMTGLEKGLPNYTGEVYVVSSENGSSRGGHYHKRATEWFTLLKGEANLKLKNVRTNEKMSIKLHTKNPITVVVKPYVFHRFDTIDCKSFLLLAYSNVLYDPKDTIQIDF